MKTPGARSLLALAILVWALWIAYFLAVRPHGWASFTDWKDSGVFGDSFGALSCIFAGLAFAGVLFSLLRDHASASRERERQYYRDLIDLAETEIAALTGGPRGQNTDKLLVAKNERAYFALQFKKLLTSESMPDAEIVKSFQVIKSFTEDDLRKLVDGIRTRLVSNGIVTTLKLREMMGSERHRKFVHDDLYQKHGQGCPDPDGYAVWGGGLYALGDSEKSRSIVLRAFRNELAERQQRQIFEEQTTGEWKV